MGTVLERAYTAQLAAAAATLYTCPTGTRARILKCTATNDTTTAVTFTIYLVPSGGAADATDLLINTKALGSQASYTCPEVTGHVLEPGDTIQGLASIADQVTLTLSVVELT